MMQCEFDFTFLLSHAVNYYLLNKDAYVYVENIFVKATILINNKIIYIHGLFRFHSGKTLTHPLRSIYKLALL